MGINFIEKAVGQGNELSTLIQEPTTRATQLHLSIPYSPRKSSSGRRNKNLESKRDSKTLKNFHHCQMRAQRVQPTILNSLEKQSR